MAYKNDSYLVIANKFGSASGDAKAQLWETYDQLRDLTVSGNGLGSGFGATGGFLYNIASLLAPSSFATVFGASQTMNVPGTSYSYLTENALPLNQIHLPSQRYYFPCPET